MLSRFLSVIIISAIGSAVALANAADDCFKLSGDAAIRACDEAIRERPQYSGSYNNRGFEYFYKQDLERALADFNKALELDPKNHEALNNRCWLRATANRDVPLALADCDAAIRLSPTKANYLDSRGLVYLRLGRFDEAISDYNAVLKINPKAAQSIYGRGLAKKKKGDQTGGEADIAAANAIDPKAAEDYERYGVR